MRALTLRDKGDDRLRLEDVAEPSPAEGAILLEAVALGVCGTDRRLVRTVPKLPPGRDRLIIGHESLGRALEAPPGSGFHEGDLVVGIVRSADPLPCPFCAGGEPDLCENGGFTERGIMAKDGFGAERFRLPPHEAVRIDPGLGLAGLLLEPTSIVAKAWERLDLLARRRPGRALVLGAGPIGLLAAMLGTGRGYDVHVMDQWDHGPKPDLVRGLGATYHTTPATLPGEFDAVLECSGALLSEAVRRTAPVGTICLIGEGEDRSVPVLGREALTSDLVEGNKTVTGIVNSNRRHFEAGHQALRRADPKWLAGLLGPFVALEDWRSAFNGDGDQVKTVIKFNPGEGP
ncbi:MAG: alcohol dehydrogenase catalytic domain-containing protein [Acidimicrobiales bacterium]